MGRAFNDAALSVDNGELCPYSEETVAGCRNYVPASEHGGFPGAAHCQWAMRLPTSQYIRNSLCRRRVSAIQRLSEVAPTPF
jgi:hypothetical protein